MDNGTAFQQLVETVTRLRAPDGCEWDRKQTPEKVKDYILEESYELLEAVLSGNEEDVEEECGDLLFLMVFLSIIYEEKQSFTVEGMLQKINAKMIRRHPHVFGDTQIDSVDDILKNWDAIKAKESGKEKRTSRLDGVPIHMPSLSRALGLQKKAAKCGFDWPEERSILDKIREEVAELEEEMDSGDRGRVEAEFGDLLFSLVNLARRRGIDPESALTATNRKFIDRFQYIERKSLKMEKSMEAMTLEEMDTLWDEAKNG